LRTAAILKIVKTAISGMSDFDKILHSHVALASKP